YRSAAVAKRFGEIERAAELTAPEREHLGRRHRARRHLRDRACDESEAPAERLCALEREVELEEGRCGGEAVCSTCAGEIKADTRQHRRPPGALPAILECRRHP